MAVQLVASKIARIDAVTLIVPCGGEFDLKPVGDEERTEIAISRTPAVVERITIVIMATQNYVGL